MQLSHPIIVNLNNKFEITDSIIHARISVYLHTRHPNRNIAQILNNRIRKKLDFSFTAIEL